MTKAEQIAAGDALALAMFLVFASGYGLALYGPKRFRQRGWPLVIGFWFPMAAITLLTIDFYLSVPPTASWRAVAIAGGILIWGLFLWLRRRLTERRAEARRQAPRPEPLWRRLSAESSLTAGCIFALAVALIEWNLYIDGTGRLVVAILWTAAAALVAGWPGPRRLRAATGIKVILIFAVIGLIALPTRAAAASVAGLAAALFFLSRPTRQGRKRQTDPSPEPLHPPRRMMRWGGGSRRR